MHVVRCRLSARLFLALAVPAVVAIALRMARLTVLVPMHAANYTINAVAPLTGPHVTQPSSHVCRLAVNQVNIAITATSQCHTRQS